MRDRFLLCYIPKRQACSSSLQLPASRHWHLLHFRFDTRSLFYQRETPQFRGTSSVDTMSSLSKSSLRRLTPSGSSNLFAKSVSSVNSEVRDVAFGVRSSACRMALIVARFIGPRRGDLGENPAGNRSISRTQSLEYSEFNSGLVLLKGPRIRRGDSGTIGVASIACARSACGRPLRALLSRSGASESCSGAERAYWPSDLRPLDLRRRTGWPLGDVSAQRPFHVLLRR